MIAGAEAARRLEGWLHAVPLRLRVLAEVRASGVPAFIVGGTLRDALLGRESHDLDLAVAGDAISLARRVADAVGVAFVPLDREHDVARAVPIAPRAGAFRLCGAAWAPTSNADLRARDFTVNAMGVAAAGPWERLLEPTGWPRGPGGRRPAGRLRRCLSRGSLAGAARGAPVRRAGLAGGPSHGDPDGGGRLAVEPCFAGTDS
jgi:hypothetical protein